MDCSLPGFSVHGILQARTLEWVAISFSNAWKWKVKVKSFSCVWLLVTPWTAAYQAPPSMGFSRQENWSRVPLPSPQASLCITNSQSLLKLMSIESVMPSNHLILCLPLFLPPSIFPSIRVFSNESALHIRWPKYWSFSFSNSPSNEHPVPCSPRDSQESSAPQFKRDLNPKKKPWLNLFRILVSVECLKVVLPSIFSDFPPVLYYPPLF